MKKILLGALILSIIAGVASTSVPATQEKTEERGYVNVSANAEKELTPDTVEISISVVTSDKVSLKKATEDNKQVTEKVLSAIKSMINPVNKDFVKTTNFNANQRYIYANGRRTFDKHEVSNTVVIHTKSVDKVGSMIDKAISLGATEVNNLDFTVSKYDDECNEILTTATKKARAQADVIVKAAGSDISGIKTLSGSCSTSGSPRAYRYAKNMMMDAAESVSDAGPSTPIEAGVVKIYANVSASFFVK